jgi:teichuronic acid exporter
MSFGAQVGRSAVWAIVGQGGIALLSVANFAVIGRFFGPKEYGSFLFAMVVLQATQWLALNAYKEPLIQAKTVTNEIINSIFIFSAAVGLILSLVMCVAALYVDKIYGSREIAICIFILAFKLLADTLMSVPAALRIRNLDFKFNAKVAIISSGIGAVTNITMLVSGIGLISLAFSQFAASLVGCILFFCYGNHRYKLFISFKELTILRGYSPHVITWQALEAVNQTIDRYFIAAKLSIIDLGLYGFARRLNDVVLEILVGATSSVSLPAFSKLQHDQERLRAAFLKAVRIITLLVLPVIAVLYATADDLIILLFGPKWTGAIPVYRWFLLLGIIQTIGILQGGLLRSLWKPGTWTRYMLAQSIANVLVLIFVTSYGIEILVAVLVIRSYALWGWIVMKTCDALNLKLSFYVWQLFKPIIIAIVATIASFLLRSFLIDLVPWVRFLLNGFIVLTIYSVLAFIFLRSVISEILLLMREVIQSRLA